ncbi:MAG: hypothetical protein AB7F22_17680 [Reyranella sp.]|uniref:hypothetical protein n=1 Tax=Reyranella sp. TaxID=1929291 RepID=UPI003D13F99B
MGVRYSNRASDVYSYPRPVKRQPAILSAAEVAAAYQPLDSGLTTIAANITAAGHALLDDASASAQRTTLGLVIDTDVAAQSHVSANAPHSSQTWLGSWIAPGSLTGSYNDWAPTGIGNAIGINAGLTGNMTLTGISRSDAGVTADGQYSRIVILRNNSASYTLTLNHESGSSSAANRFFLPYARSYLLAPYSSAIACYSYNRWAILTDPSYLLFANVTGATLTADTNNLAITGQDAGDLCLISQTGGPWNLTGIVAPAADYKRLTLYNNAAVNLVLKHNSGSSSAGNKFWLPSTSDLTIPPYGSKMLVYFSSQWRPVG